MYIKIPKYMQQQRVSAMREFRGNEMVKNRTKKIKYNIKINLLMT